MARIGGEFTVLLENVISADEAAIAAERVGSEVSQPVKLGDHELVVTASIGIALSSPSITASGLLRNADLSMYHAKRRGDGNDRAGTEDLIESRSRDLGERRSGLHEHRARRATSVPPAEVIEQVLNR